MNVLKWVVVTFLAIVVLLIIYGIAIEPRFILNIDRETAIIPNLPSAWEGKRVAVVSDFQVGMWLDNLGMIERVAAQLVEEQPAVVLLLGDYIYHPLSNPEVEIEKIKGLLQPIPQSGIPTLGVLGNHDYAASGRDDPINEEVAARVIGALESIGIDILQNEAVALPPPADHSNEPLYFVGLGSDYVHKTDVRAAFSGVPEDAPRFVFTGEPGAFPLLPPNSAPIMTAGHTHCGQIRIPGLPEWSYLALVQDDPVHTDGWVRDSDYGALGNNLYITCGIGFSILPIRINTPPEISIFTLSGN